ncbi:hypothetical protein SAMN05192558_109131 [Actinokineospora alba]|uniref:Uncharacterized protein n=1 Tax=Actinokineospora alba TaxID=504798 RepID=A0A1H0SWC4_9PSEU|nr:hypothetical protein C8E96_2013 [Actinokineospora alba]SDJ36487.1 hypothetical protein SAMN05421871_11415 [Actinokineospora alba]SDP45974.1 hypothetical protein SAMN05192558_109131 [Actinokineospora alba]
MVPFGIRASPVGPARRLVVRSPNRREIGGAFRGGNLLDRGIAVDHRRCVTRPTRFERLSLLGPPNRREIGGAFGYRGIARRPILTGISATPVPVSRQDFFRPTNRRDEGRRLRNGNLLAKRGVGTVIRTLLDSRAVLIGTIHLRRLNLIRTTNRRDKSRTFRPNRRGGVLIRAVLGTPPIPVEGLRPRRLGHVRATNGLDKGRPLRPRFPTRRGGDLIRPVLDCRAVLVGTIRLGRLGLIRITNRRRVNRAELGSPTVSVEGIRLGRLGPIRITNRRGLIQVELGSPTVSAGTIRLGRLGPIRITNRRRVNQAELGTIHLGRLGLVRTANRREECRALGGGALLDWGFGGLEGLGLFEFRLSDRVGGGCVFRLGSRLGERGVGGFARVLRGGRLLDRTCGRLIGPRALNRPEVGRAFSNACAAIRPIVGYLRPGGVVRSRRGEVRASGAGGLPRLLDGAGGRLG